MVIDCHAHYVAPSVIQAVQAGTWRPHLTYQEGARCFAFPDFTTRSTPNGMDDVTRRLQHMDQVGVDLELLSTWVDLLGPDLPESTALNFHRAVNRGLAEAADQHPDRFRFLASVPLPFGDGAARELTFAVAQLGAVGALIGTHVGGRSLDDRRFDPFWAAAEELDVPVVLHPLSRAMMVPLEAYYLGNLLGNPFDTTVAASRLIFGGVLDRFSQLQIVLLHGGGYLPYAVGRLDHGYQVRPETKEPQRRPSEYLNRFTYDHIVYDPKILSVLVDRVGSDRIVLGSDYPFDMEPMDVLGLAKTVFGDQAGDLLGQTASRVFSKIER